MKIVMAIGASVVFGIASGVVAAIVIVPFAILDGGCAAGTPAAGLSGMSNDTAAIVAGTILLAVLLYVIALRLRARAVFFPAYAMYFFAECLSRRCIRSYIHLRPGSAAACASVGSVAGTIG